MKLRGDAAPQHEAQRLVAAARAQWTQHAVIAPVLTDLQRFGAGSDLAECSHLKEALTSLAAGSAVAEVTLEIFAACVSQAPLGMVPFRHEVTPEGATLVLAVSGQSQLLLCQRGRAMCEPDCVTMSDVERHDLVLAGRAEALMCCLKGTRLETTPIALGSGSQFQIAGGDKGIVTRQVHDPLVTLRLVRQQAQCKPTRQIAIASGAVVATAHGTMAESRRRLAIDVLAALRHPRAAQTLSEEAMQGDPATRWEALRQCLALDTGRGFSTLTRVADNADDLLSGRARALRDHLLAAHPVLATLIERKAA